MIWHKKDKPFFSNWWKFNYDRYKKKFLHITILKVDPVFWQKMLLNWIPLSVDRLVDLQFIPELSRKIGKVFHVLEYVKKFSSYMVWESCTCTFIWNSRSFLFCLIIFSNTYQINTVHYSWNDDNMSSLKNIGVIRNSSYRQRIR